MSIYLNTTKPYENYIEIVNEEYFVDKSAMISILNKKLSTKGKYVCITRPRRFGKSSAADMIGAYYSKAVNSKDIFDKLNISSFKSYEENLNKYNVINISFNDISDKGSTYEDYIDMIRNSIKKDIKEKYPFINPDEYYNLSSMLRETKDKFIFIFDEWDYIFNNNLFEENQNNFLEFLRNLLKDEPYVLLVYMTGVLPIKRYSSGSALNMFDEFTFLKDRQFAEYFGFTEEEKTELIHNFAVATTKENREQFLKLFDSSKSKKNKDYEKEQKKIYKWYEKVDAEEIYFECTGDEIYHDYWDREWVYDYTDKYKIQNQQ